jgi:hypothetical protein
MMLAACECPAMIQLTCNLFYGNLFYGNLFYGNLFLRIRR